jgi:NAD(P)-dependent dehydrogenase (short-subunit alcohol dehydrogenase family)
MQRSRAVLITGCSSGIGRAIAERLARSGWRVYATARDVSSVDDLKSHGCKVQALDVSDLNSMRAAVTTIEESEGSVGVLINNAGFGLHGAVETTSLDDVRRQFETNFFGPATLTQLVLPAMRRQGWGKLVNMSSMGGRLTLPGGAFYHASKHAIEAFSDALRLELRIFGIDVIVIEPGIIKTQFGDTAVGTVDANETNGPYDLFNQKVMLKIDAAYRNRMFGGPARPETVARVVERAISSQRPRARYPVTMGARALMALRRVLPDRAFDSLVSRSYSL